MSGGTPAAGALPGRLHVAIQQPTLTKYRVPFYQELARRPGLDIELLYGSRRDWPNVQPSGFRARLIRFHEWQVGRHPLYWHAAQLEAVRPGCADVAILSWDLHYATLLPALLRARRAGTPVLLWGHGYSKSEAAFKRRLRNRTGRLATAVVVYNQRAADWLCSDGFEAERVFVATNSLDIEPIERARRHWERQPPRLRAFALEHDLPPGPVLLYVSRLDPDNRLDLLLQATAKLRPQWPDLRVVIIGTGAQLPDLQEQSRRLGLDQHVRFLGAIYDEVDLAPWFLSADLFVYPANIGLSLLHSFGYGLPVVTSDDLDAQNPEIEAIEDGKNGLLYAAGSSDALARTIATALADPAMRRQMSAAAEQTVRGRYSLKTMADGMEAAIRFAAGFGR